MSGIFFKLGLFDKMARKEEKKKRNESFSINNAYFFRFKKNSKF